ncbi:MAG: hypothetical protein ACK4GM_02395 [Tabrizicola sp.]
MASTCVVSGQLVGPDGSPVVGVPVTWIRAPEVVAPVSGGGVAPERVTVTTDSVGNLSVDLVAGRYFVVAALPGGRRIRATAATVPNAPTASLESVLEVTGPVAPGLSGGVVRDLLSGLSGDERLHASAIAGLGSGGGPIGIPDVSGLQAALDGKAAVVHGHSVATSLVDGFMSAADKTKLDGIAAGANTYSHPDHTGDVTSLGDGATTIAAGAVTNAKLADMAAGTIKGRTSAGTGAPEDLTPAQARSILNVADGATANASDAALRDRATHTGTQPATTITGLAAVATSGSAGDLTAGSLPAARFDDTSHGSRAGGALHAAATPSVAGFMSAADKTKLDGIAAGANAYSHPDHTGDVTSLGDGATTIAAGAVTNAKLADMATATIKGRASAGTGDPEDLTAAQATALLDTFTSGAKGLAPASGGGTTNFLRADGTWAAPAGGGGISDGDKGDITVSGSGTVWTIDAGAVTLGKLADITTDSFLGRDSAGTGAPEVLTPTQARAILNVADGATANASDAALRDRATHTGTQPATTITGLAAVATSGSAADLTAGTLPAARFDDTSHGSRAGGALHAAATPSVAGFMSAADKTKLDGIAAGANAYSHPNHTGDVTSLGDGATTIAAGAVTNAKLASVATATIKGRASAGTGDPEDLTGTQATALLDVFTSGAKGLAPASGGGTTNFLRADGTWAAPAGGGGGSPGGASGEIQFNDSGSFGGAADVEVEDGQLRLPTIATPAAPAADGVKLFGSKVAGRAMPAFMGPSGLESALQPLLARNKVGMWLATGNGGADTSWGLALTAGGTATGENVATTNLYTYSRRRSWRVTTASTTATAGLRCNYLQWTLGGPSADLGGFLLVWRWGPATGVATRTTRAFVGMRGSVAAPTDVDPSTLTNLCGMGWDSGDANIQFIHNDGTGAATKIDLGASFPRPTVDLTSVYEVALFAPPGTTQSLSYEVTDLASGAVATGTVTTDIPALTQLLAPYGYISVGGTSSVIGFAVMSLYIETDY